MRAAILNNRMYCLILSMVFVFCGSFVLRAEEVIRTIRFQNPASNVYNISNDDLLQRLTCSDELDVESVEAEGVNLLVSKASPTAMFRYGCVSITGGKLHFNLSPQSGGDVTGIRIGVYDFTSSTEVSVNGVTEFERSGSSSYSLLTFKINENTSTVTVDVPGPTLYMECIDLYFDVEIIPEPERPVIYNEAGSTAPGESVTVTAGRLIRVESAGADRIVETYNDTDIRTYEGSSVQVCLMEPGVYTFTGVNRGGESEPYTVYVAANMPNEGRELTLVTDESGLMRGYLYVYQIFTEDGRILALGTELKDMGNFGKFPEAKEIEGDGTTYEQGMETILLGKSEDGWTWKLNNMGKYINNQPSTIFVGNAARLQVKFNEDNIAEIYYETAGGVTYKFCYSEGAGCFSVTANYSECLFGRLYRVDPVATIPIETPENDDYDDMVEIGGNQCVTRTITVSFPDPFTDSRKNYTLCYGGLQLAAFELNGTEYTATASLPYIEGAELMVISSGDDTPAMFPLGSPWRDLEETLVDQPDGVPARLTYNVSTRNVEFRQALNFECDTPCELEISGESHPSGELVRENDGRYYYVIEDYVQDAKLDDRGELMLSEAERADVYYDVTPVFKVASNSAPAPARVMAREGEAYNVYTLRGTTLTHNYTATDMSVSGIEDIRVDATTAAPATYYTIDGLNLGTTLPAVPGLYIRHQGNNTSKILIK